MYFIYYKYFKIVQKKKPKNILGDEGRFAVL